MEPKSQNTESIKRERYHAAVAFAKDAHEGQVRKYTGEPYVNHCQRVVDIILRLPDFYPNRQPNRQLKFWEIITAAWLHDTVEDCGVELQEIEDKFGVEVAQLVSWLTDVSTPEDGNRAVRKAIDRKHLAMAPAEAQTIKLADLIDNSKSILKHDPKFAKVYLQEKKLLLEVLTEGDKNLWIQAAMIVEDGLEVLLERESHDKLTTSGGA